MPRAWTAKDERQYEAVKESERGRGRSPERAEEIAARTVNKRRQREGRTRRSTPGGVGNPHVPLQARTKQELYNRAKELDVAGRSRMDKSELVEAIRRANG